MTTAADITAATTAIAAVSDANTKAALTAVMLVVADHTTDLTTLITANTAVDTAQATLIAENAAAIAANPYVSRSEAGGILPTPPNQSPAAGATEDDPDLLISVPSRISAAAGQNNALINFTTAPTLPGATHASAYSKQLAAAGGSGTGYTYAVVGALPAGMTLSSGGLIAGTPTAAGSAVLIITVADSFGDQVSQAFTLVIA